MDGCSSVTTRDGCGSSARRATRRRCDPLASYEVATTPLRTPAVDGDRVIVTSDNGALARVLLDCRPDDACDPVRVRKLAAPALAPAVIAPEATIAGTQDGSIESFKW